MVVLAGRTQFSRTAFRWPPLAPHTARLHEAFDGRIGTQRPQRRIGLDGTREIVVVQLITPVGVIPVLLPKILRQFRANEADWGQTLFFVR
jgi:hypothetical protein